MFLGLRRIKDIDLAKEDERPRSKGAEIPRAKKRPEPQRRLDSYFGGGSQKKARRSATSDDVANESDAGPWACSKCTYLHKKADEWGYLACNMCGAPKPKQDGA